LFPEPLIRLLLVLAVQQVREMLRAAQEAHLLFLALRLLVADRAAAETRQVEAVDRVVALAAAALRDRQHLVEAERQTKAMLAAIQ
jgi:hypothetical protein